jgi:predicted homoserine dehydrogenase-like protein
LLDNSARPRISVAALAKLDLPTGTRITRGIGGFQVRGESVLISNHPDHVPIGLLEEAVLKSSVQAGQILTWNDIEVPDSMALSAWHAVMGRLG